jgi:hypothetical protein
VASGDRHFGSVFALVVVNVLLSRRVFQGDNMTLMFAFLWCLWIVWRSSWNEYKLSRGKGRRSWSRSPGERIAISILKLVIIHTVITYKVGKFVFISTRRLLVVKLQKSEASCCSSVTALICFQNNTNYLDDQVRVLCMLL